MEHPKLAEWWHFPFWVLFELYIYLLLAGLFTIVLLLGVWAVAAVAKASGMGLRTAPLDT